MSDDPPDLWIVLDATGRPRVSRGDEADSRALAEYLPAMVPERGPYRVVRYVPPSAERARLRAVVEGMRRRATAETAPALALSGAGWNAALDAVLAAMGDQ